MKKILKLLWIFQVIAIFFWIFGMVYFGAGILFDVHIATVADYEPVIAWAAVIAFIAFALVSLTRSTLSDLSIDVSYLARESEPPTS